MIKDKLIGVKMDNKMFQDLIDIADKFDVTVPELIRKSMKRVIKNVK